jgi:hypothetical protein
MTTVSVKANNKELLSFECNTTDELSILFKLQELLDDRISYLCSLDNKGEYTPNDDE